MAAVTILLCIGALIALSSFYATRFPRGARVAMQWRADGQPGWRAPVWIALSLTPLLVLFILGVTAIIDVVATNATGAGSHLPEAILLVEAVFFVLVHAAHMHFALRDQRRQAQPSSVASSTTPSR